MHIHERSLMNISVHLQDARTTWFDSGVRQAIDNGIKQVVIIAAGFDTRSYRLHSQGVKVRQHTFLKVLVVPEAVVA